MSVKETILKLTETINRNPEGVHGIQTVYQFDISGEEEGTYQIKIDNGKLEFSEGTPFDAKCTLQLSSSDFLKLVAGELNATTAFMFGKLKVKGDMSLALKLQSILKSYHT